MDHLSSNASTDCPETLLGQSVTLRGHMTPTEFRKAFVGRVRQIRESLGWSRSEAAEEMGVSLDTWIKYETRTPLPHHLIPRFCRATRADIWFLFTGEHRRAPKNSGEQRDPLQRAKNA